MEGWTGKLGKWRRREQNGSDLLGGGGALRGVEKEQGPGDGELVVLGLGLPDCDNWTGGETPSRMAVLDAHSPSLLFGLHCHARNAPEVTFGAERHQSREIQGQVPTSFSWHTNDLHP